MPGFSSLRERFQKLNAYRMADYSHPAARYTMVAALIAAGAAGLVYSMNEVTALNGDPGIVQREYDSCIKKYTTFSVTAQENAAKEAKTRPAKSNDQTLTNKVNVAAFCPAHDRESYERIMTLKFGESVMILIMAGIAAFGYRNAHGATPPQRKKPGEDPIP